MSFDADLERILIRRLSDSRVAMPKQLADSIRYSLLAPGKRIRPRLTLATSEMLELHPQVATLAASALEMAHCFTLIHDDLPCMDNDDFRRGQPTNHKKFGEATALLAGDGLIAMAVETLMDAEIHAAPEALIQALRRLTNALGPHGVIGGQAAESELTKSSSINDLASMHARKTGALFEAAILIPMDLAGKGRSLELENFAKSLGLAFQVADDLEDATQDQKSQPTPYTSVLHFMSENEARSDSYKKLSETIEPVKAKWGSQAQPLILIADEVLKTVLPK